MDRIYYTVFTIPAGTPQTAPTTLAWPLEDNQLKGFTVQVPDGPCGLSGFRVMQAQQQVVPFANDSYIVSNDHFFTFEWDDEITSTGLVLSGYNTDIFDHSYYCTATVTNLPVPGESPPAEVVTPGEDVSDQDVTTDDLSADTILSDDTGDDTGYVDGIIPPPVPATPVPVTTPATPVPAVKPKVKAKPVKKLVKK